MDIATHALASFVLMRATFPHAPRIVWPVVIVAGIAADVDGISEAFGPAAYLKWHLSFTHTLLAAVILAGLCALLYRVFAPDSLRSRFSLVAVLVLTLLAGCLHLATDLCQSGGVLLFWPFSTQRTVMDLSQSGGASLLWLYGPQRIAADWLPCLDPIILAVLIAAIFLPELLRLVSAEIGAKDKKPRGQTGAIIALSLIALYIGARALLHSNAVGTLESVTYRGELPRRVAAYPVSTSLFTWNGIVETESALHEITVSTSSANALNPGAGVTIHKPEASPLLETARGATSVAAFLRVARFPKATIEKTEAGFRIDLRDLRYAATGESEREVVAIVELNPAGIIVNQKLVWARDNSKREMGSVLQQAGQPSNKAQS